MLKKLFLTVTFVSLATAAAADDYVITIKDHKFSPTELTIPAGQTVKVKVQNNDATAEEFESSDLDREKVVAANGHIVVNLGPLDPGTYKYFGDFHRDSANGVIIAK